MPILSINHNTLEFRPGMTILEVARKNNIHIPTLCHLAGAYTGIEVVIPGHGDFGGVDLLTHTIKLVQDERN